MYSYLSYLGQWFSTLSAHQNLLGNFKSILVPELYSRIRISRRWGPGNGFVKPASVMLTSAKVDSNWSSPGERNQKWMFWGLPPRVTRTYPEFLPTLVLPACKPPFLPCLSPFFPEVLGIQRVCGESLCAFSHSVVQSVGTQWRMRGKGR